MKKILFLYNDLDDVTGISNVMAVVERYARNSKHGNFKVISRPQPTINFEDGSSVTVRPATQGLSNLANYDKVYVDETIDLLLDTSRFGKNIELYGKNSFTHNKDGGK